MGKKGSKRKTRWRTLSIGAPPGEEDDEEGLRNGYVKNPDNDTGTHSFDRNGQGGYKPRRTATGTSGSSGYAGSSSKLHKEDSSGSPSQPKIIFNEDEYTRITTPRQDVLFKKGYLSRKKPWAGNASTSATPSTTESQSASHSTADGSETTEDQQLLDRDSGNGEYPMAEQGAQLGYGTFYDHASGYYYKYPVMLVGPAPVPAQIAPNVLAAVPCGPVPLRPIEWINPAFVPKLAGQPYCMMDYQTGQNMESATVVEEQESTLLPVENSNGTYNESGTGGASCGASVAGEAEEQTEEENIDKEKQEEEQGTEKQQPEEEQHTEEQQVEEQSLENGMNGGPYLEPMLMQQPVHVSHVIPAVPQPYMYPGHYMFGPPLVNVNGVTIQSGPMIRITDVAAMTAACAKRRKKKKRRKQRTPALGNTEDEEEAEYSSECDNGLPSSRVPWTGCPTSSTTTTTTTNRPLNPECQEFQLRTVVEPHTSLTPVPTSNNAPACEEKSNGANSSRGTSSDAMVSLSGDEAACYGSVAENFTSQEDGTVTDNRSGHVIEMSLEDSQSTTLNIGGLSNKADELTNCLVENEKPLLTEETTETANGARTEKEQAPSSTDVNKSANDLSSANDKCERSMDEMNDINVLPNSHPQHHGNALMNGKTDSESCNEEAQSSNVSPVAKIASRPSSPCIDNLTHEKIRARSSTPKISSAMSQIDMEPREPQQNHDSSNSKTNNVQPKRKYSAKGLKFVREPTPGPDLDDIVDADLETKKVTSCDSTQLSNSIETANNSCSKSHYSTLLENSVKMSDQKSDNYLSEVCNNNKTKVTHDETIEGSNEDSGFESQTRLSEYPITEAVKEWLRRANSPDLFITCRISSDSETEDDDETNEKPPKNLHGNPMPALSANSSVDNVPLSRVANYGEFARTSNIDIGHTEAACASAVSRKKRDMKGTKRKSGEKINRRVRNSDEKMQNQVVSSSDSCGQQEDSMHAVRKKNLPKQDVDGVCEFSEMDSVAGMRVAVNSRVDSKRVNTRRTRRQGKCNREPVENIELKLRRIENVNNENDEGIVEDTVSVRTFEKGEIVVSEDGKLLTTSSYEPILRTYYDASNVITTGHEDESMAKKEKLKGTRNNGSDKEENGIVSVGSIEEPDVLECWEAETIEPVVTPRKMFQSRGILCEGEVAEDGNLETEHVNIEHVQKYYRLARQSITSIDEETSEMKTSMNSPTSGIVPNNSEQMIESFCSEEVPAVVSNGKCGGTADDKKIPIDEAFEVYESCYTGKAPFMTVDSKMFKHRTLHGQEGEGPVPCRAVCCNIQ